MGIPFQLKVQAGHTVGVSSKELFLLSFYFLFLGRVEKILFMSSEYPLFENLKPFERGLL